MAQNTKDHFHINSPLVESVRLSQILGAPVYLKLDALQPSGNITKHLIDLNLDCILNIIISFDDGLNASDLNLIIHKKAVLKFADLALNVGKLFTSMESNCWSHLLAVSGTDCLFAHD